MNKSEIKKFVDMGYGRRKIAKEFGKSGPTIDYYLKKFNLKTKFTKDSKSKYEEIDWIEFQKIYDTGVSWKGMNKLGYSDRSIRWAINNSKIKFRNKSESIKLHIKNHGARKHSEETKKKISKIRIEYLKNNPDKVPYLINHSSKKSWPEEVFENALKSSGIDGWIYHYQNGIYQYDFAFPKKKIDIEVDGGTHKTEKVKKIDERRDKFSKENGWVVLRFTAERVKKDVMSCINEIRKLL